MPNVSADTPRVAVEGYENDPFTLWLQQLWWTERADRNMKNADDRTTPEFELNDAHMRRVIFARYEGMI